MEYISIQYQVFLSKSVSFFYNKLITFVYTIYDISTWIWTEARHDMFDYVPVVTDRMVLAIMKQAVQMNAWDMYFRPFTTDAWIVLGTVTVLIPMVLHTISLLNNSINTSKNILNE